MLRHLLLVALLGTTALTLSACGDGNPFFEPDQDGDGIPDSEDPDADGNGVPDADEDDDGCAICGDPDLPPGTDEPSADAGIFRYEDIDDQGGGYVRSVSYNAARDEFTVDNLAFDGANVYIRPDDAAVRSMGGYAVYEAAETAIDDVTGEVLDQFDYRAIYGVSQQRILVDGQRVPMSQFAIVRTGSYVDYGFGGFVYERNGTVELPETGFARFTGGYAGMRVFQSRGGLEYTRGDVRIDIDFDDFNAGNGVRGRVFNREAFDIEGNPIALGDGEDDLQLPNLVFVVGPGVMTDGGEISSGMVSNIPDPETGTLTQYEEGTYYGIIGGEGADMEIVGVFVVESTDPRYDTTVQETGGFIVYR